MSKFLSQMRSFAGNAEIPPMELSESTKKVMNDVRKYDAILFNIRLLTRRLFADSQSFR